jgi:hypothetical protein
MKMTDTNPPHPVDHAWFSQAALDVTAERRRQVEREGWTPEHDDEHDKGELALAAGCYASGAAGWTSAGHWPWMDRGAREGWKPGPPRRMLVKAAALLLAEIERVDRAAGSADGSGVKASSLRASDGDEGKKP